MIETKNLTKIYNQKRGTIQANSAISLAIGRGEIFSLLGPNGAGKTTLIKILATLILPSSGSARVNGYDILKDSSKIRRSIGLSTGRERSFYFRLTGKQNLDFFGTLQGLAGKALKIRIEQILKEIGLYEYRDLKYMKYSSGMKKKLSLARAMLTDPPVCLLDEPTAGIDPAAARDIRAMIRELKDRGKTVLLTTHDIHEAEELSDRIGILKAGRLIRVDTLEHLRNLFQEIIVMKIAGSFDSGAVHGLQAIEDLDDVVAEDGLVKVYAREPRQLLDTVIKRVQEKAIIEDIRVDTMSLEDIFIRMTEDERNA